MTELTLPATESSCDETDAAVIRMRHDDIDINTLVIPEVEVFADVVVSSMEQYARSGGVVPETASRAYLEALQLVVSEVRAQVAAKLGIDISIPDAVAAIVGPGLAGALLVGLAGAEAYAATWGVPFYDISHLGGRVVVGALDGADLSNAVALLAPGGHTQLLRVQGAGRPMEELGSTLDDAVGEAYDKVSGLLGLGCPGGPIIDKLARQGNHKTIAFPRATMRQQDARHDFSFSGLKTAVARYVKAAEKEGRDYPVRDACASLQEAVCDVLTRRAIRAAQDMGATTLLLGGGVAANSRLCELAAARATSAGITLHVPPTKLCTGNGVMVGVVTVYLIATGAKLSGYACLTDSSMPMEDPVMH